MDDRINAAKKSKKNGGILRGLIDRFKRSNPANAHPNSTRPASAETIPSGKYLSVVYDDSTSLQVAMVRTVLNSYLTDLACSAHHSDPTTPFQSTTLSPSSSTPDLWLRGSSQGEITRLNLRLTSDTSQRARRQNQPYFDSYQFNIPFANTRPLRKDIFNLARLSSARLLLETDSQRYTHGRLDRYGNVAQEGRGMYWWNSGKDPCCCC
jgi:hypothetical protein